MRTAVPKCRHPWWMWSSPSNLVRLTKTSKKRCSLLLSCKAMRSNQTSTSLLALIRVLLLKTITIESQLSTHLTTKPTKSPSSNRNNGSHLGKSKKSKSHQSRKDLFYQFNTQARNPSNRSNSLLARCSAKKWTALTLIWLIGTTKMMTFVSLIHLLSFRLNSLIRWRMFSNPSRFLTVKTRVATMKHPLILTSRLTTYLKRNKQIWLIKKTQMMMERFSSNWIKKS